MKKVSLLVSCYQQEKTIPFYFKSLLNQTHLPDELIIADDASTDNTREIINKFKFPQNCDVKKVFRETNVG